MKDSLAIAGLSSLVASACAGALVVSPSAPSVAAIDPTVPASDASAPRGPSGDAAIDEPHEDAAAAQSEGADAGVRKAHPSPTTPDPLGGVFTLGDATAGLPKKGTLIARIVTDRGTLQCRLFDDRAPNTVATFIGLARGLRPWFTPDGRWETRPAYDGTTFHRVLRGFILQGGDPWGDGRGGPGFVFADEIWAGAKHDRAGLLCIANRGPNTNGMQFYITDAPAPYLDGAYNSTIFGECSPVSRIHALASVPVHGETPDPPLRIETITVERRPR